MIDLFIDTLGIFARGGGGGSSGGGGGGIIALPIIIISIIVAWYRRKKRIERAKQLQSAAVQADSSWSDEVIHARVNDLFYRFQRDWSTFNYASMKSYITPTFFNHMQLILLELQGLKRKNVVANPTLDGAALYDIRDSTDDELDEFDVEVRARADDALIYEPTGETIYTDERPWVEVWHFERENGEWCIDGISQLSSMNTFKLLNKTVSVNTEGVLREEDIKKKHTLAEKSVSFVQANQNFFYNADFGWLLMPRGGLLFNDSDFLGSDINHHVIGAHRGVLVQLFEYAPYSGDVKKRDRKRRGHWRMAFYAKTLEPKFLVVAATLPKSYSNILVVKSWLLARSVSNNLRKIETEWIDFNSKYKVYASDIDKVNSLELLHPVFMEKLEALPFTVNIEIIKNHLYFYTKDMKNADYETLLSLMNDAFDEMKM